MMNLERNYSAAYKPTFQEWVVQRHGMSCREIHDNFKKTGTNREYQKSMAFLRQKYREDMIQREMLIASNPFQEQEEN